MRVVCNPAPSSTIKEASYILIVKVYSVTRTSLKGPETIRLLDSMQESEKAYHNLSCP